MNQVKADKKLYSNWWLMAFCGWKPPKMTVSESIWQPWLLHKPMERSLNIDFLLGYPGKQRLPKRSWSFETIITQPLSIPNGFSEHFDNAPVIEVRGVPSRRKFVTAFIESRWWYWGFWILLMALSGRRWNCARVAAMYWSFFPVNVIFVMCLKHWR